MAYLLKSIRSAYVCSFFSDNQLAHCIIQPCNNCQTALPDGSNESPPFQKRLHVCSQLATFSFAKTLQICLSYKQNDLENVFWQSLKNIFHIYELNSIFAATYFQIDIQRQQRQKQA